MAVIYETKEFNIKNITAYRTEDAFGADISVCVVDSSHAAKGDDLWYYTDNEFHASSTIQWIDDEFQADLVVRFVDSTFDAGWGKENHKLKGKL